MTKPKLPPGVARDKILHIRITEAGLNAIEQQAKERGRTVSDHIRDVMRAYTLGHVKLT